MMKGPTIISDGSGVIVREQDVTTTAEERRPTEYLIKTPLDVITHLGGSPTSGGYVYSETSRQIKKMSLLNDYHFSISQRLDILSRSMCAGRDLEYITVLPANKDDMERVRIFFDCAGSCLAVVDHARLGATTGTGHTIDMPSSFCEQAWDGSGVKITETKLP